MALIPSTKASRAFALAEQMDDVGPATETRLTLEGFSAMGTTALEGRSKQDLCLEGPDLPSGVSSGGEEGRQ